MLEIFENQQQYFMATSVLLFAFIFLLQLPFQECHAELVEASVATKYPSAGSG